MAKKPAPNIIRRISEEEMRRIFNERQYTKKVEDGELHLEVRRSKPCLNADIQNYIPDTESQEIHIYDAPTPPRKLLVKAHRYLRPDGKLAASGMIDPKRIWEESGEILGLISPPDEEE